jgi:hypothetical protein
LSIEAIVRVVRILGLSCGAATGAGR